MLEFLIDNIYIRVGKEIFRQQVGIPMGTDCAPFLANLFLFYYEYNYMKDLIKSNIHLAEQFSYTIRYIDDFLNNRFFGHSVFHFYFQFSKPLWLLII